jgi:Rhodanese-related sulfurtransferase
MKRILLAASMILSLFAVGCAQMTSTTVATTTADASSTAVSTKGYTIIKADEAKKMMDAGNVIVVDVRTDSEYADKHIPNAINIPVESITTTQPDLLPDLHQTILVYCRTGIRAATASQKLVDIGYTKVYDMGGIVDWPYDTVQ